MGYAFILAAIVTNHTFKETDQLSCKKLHFLTNQACLRPYDYNEKGHNTGRKSTFYGIVRQTQQRFSC